MNDRKINIDSTQDFVNFLFNKNKCFYYNGCYYAIENNQLIPTERRPFITNLVGLSLQEAYENYLLKQL